MFFIDKFFIVRMFGKFSEFGASKERLESFRKVFSNSDYEIYGVSTSPLNYTMRIPELSSLRIMIKHNSLGNYCVISNEQIFWYFQCNSEFKNEQFYYCENLGEITNIYHKICAALQIEIQNFKSNRLAVNRRSIIKYSSDIEKINFLKNFSSPFSRFNESFVAWNNSFLLIDETNIFSSIYPEKINLNFNIGLGRIADDISQPNKVDNCFITDFDINTAIERERERFGPNDVEEFCKYAVKKMEQITPDLKKLAE